MTLLVAVAIVLFAAWHTIKHGVPRAYRATSAARRRSIDGWAADHPAAPKSARWLASVGYAATAVRHGPRYARREFAAAWREGRDRGRAKFRPEQYTQEPPEGGQPETGPPAESPPQQSTGGPQVGDRTDGMEWDGAAWTAVCPTCDRPMTGYDDNGYLHCPVCGLRAVDRGKPKPPQRRPDGRPDLRPVPDATPAGSTQTPDAATARSEDMAIQTATGGEISNAEQFYAEAKAIETEAAAELEDAAGDSGRAQEDLARVERMIASLSKQAAVKRDIAAVAALKEPAAARAQAAKDRHAAAERRLAEAKNVVTIAARHVQMIGQAAGPFYNPRG